MSVRPRSWNFGDVLRQNPIHQPSNAHYRGNLYIQPVEVFNFLARHSEFWKNGKIDLKAVKKFLDAAVRAKKRSRSGPDDHGGQVSGFWSTNRDGDEFIVNEYWKLHENQVDADSLQEMYVTDENGEDLWLNFGMFPAIIPEMSKSLLIPGNDVFDLPTNLFLYLLYRLADGVKQRGTFTILFNLKLTSNMGDDLFYPIYKPNSRDPIKVVNGLISEEDLEWVYLTILRKYSSFVFEGEGSWSGSEDSGTRIIIKQYVGGEINFLLTLKLLPAPAVMFGNKWSPKVGEFVKTVLNDGNDDSRNVSGIISVKNDDYHCLLHCIILGLILEVRGSPDTQYYRADNEEHVALTMRQIFGRNTLWIEPSEIYCQATYNIADSTDLNRWIRKLAKFVIPTYISTEPDEQNLQNLLQDIDKEIGTMYSSEEFKSKFSKMESVLVPPEFCGINIYGMDYTMGKHMYPLYISPNNKGKMINLLCFTPQNADCSHFALITNMTRLLYLNGGKQFFTCNNCGQSFYHRRLLMTHQCDGRQNLVSGNVPGPGGYHFSRQCDNPQIDIVVGSCPRCRLCFTSEFTFNYHKEHCLMSGESGYRHVSLVSYIESERPALRGEPYNQKSEEEHEAQRHIMYADFECSISRESGEHKFMSYGIYDTLSEEFKLGYDIADFFNFILHKAFDVEKSDVYVYFHNAMGYDVNFILRFVLSNPAYEKWGIQVIMKSMNKLQKLVFDVMEPRTRKRRKIHIGDTFHFLTLSLERLVNSCRSSNIDENRDRFRGFFNVMTHKYPWIVREDANKVLQKNIFPYKFFDHEDKLDTPIEEFTEIFRPNPENLKFFSERINLEDLEKNFPEYQLVVDKFRCRSARDYHDIYLTCDVMQLADIFTRTMNILKESHGIHLTRYLGMPSATWAAFLRHEPHSLNMPLYRDTFFAEFFKAMTRGGISAASVRYAKSDARHKILYFDVNGLYAYVMMKYKFPCGEFKFVPFNIHGKERCHALLKELFEDFETNSCGMAFCVDLHIPDDVKFKTNYFPFAPEHRKLYREFFKDFDAKELSPFLKKWSEANGNEQMKEFTGLVCTLYDKEKYNVHWRLLQFYMKHGVEVTQIHFGVSFDEAPYLSSYIGKNIAIRNMVSDELSKTLYKLMNNSIYGKTFESPFKRKKYEIVRDVRKLQGLLDGGNISAMSSIDDLGWIIRMDGEEITLDKPTYIGACVCEFAKLHMYELLYDKFFAIFPSTDYINDTKCKVLYTDTDSFIMQIELPEGIETAEQLFQFINERSLELFGEILIGGDGGKIKSETGNDFILKCIALRAKLYAYVTEGGKYGQRAKGTSGDAQATQLNWDEYEKVYTTLQSKSTVNMQFLRREFKVFSLELLKQSVAINDAKRFSRLNSPDTFAYGHPLIEREMMLASAAEDELPIFMRRPFIEQEGERVSDRLDDDR